MAERLAAWILDESQWLAFAMLSALVVVGACAGKRRAGPSPPLPTPLSTTLSIQGALNLFYALVIGVMAAGHLLAVTVKLAQGTLRGSPWLLYPFGLALLAPAAWLARQSLRPGAGAWRRRTAALNGCVALVLLVLGLHNAPLAVPAVLNVATLFQARRAWGRAILGVAVLVNLALLAGALVFAASGQSFEQFSAEVEGSVETH